MAQDTVLPDVPRRAAALELMDPEEFENPVGTTDGGEVLIQKELFKDGVKPGDEVLVRATVSSTGSKVGIMPLEVVGAGGSGDGPQPEGNPPETENDLS